MSAALNDTSETVHIASLPLLKMLKHARAGVPMEVMGLLLGEFIDDYTVRVVDVFAMPQQGSAEAVEAVDPVYQQKMLNMLSQTHRPEMVIGWYHSHPSYGCWLSSIDMLTQHSYQSLNERAIAIVIDPIQSVKGKVVIDAFRLCDGERIRMKQEPRQTTSNIGYLNKPSAVALKKGLNKHYYSLLTDNYDRKNKGNDLNMLMKTRNKNWNYGFKLDNFDKFEEDNKEQMEGFKDLSGKYAQRLKDEVGLNVDERMMKFIGKVDPRKRLNMLMDEVLKRNINQNIGMMINMEVFGGCRRDIVHIMEEEKTIKSQMEKPQIICSR